MATVGFQPKHFYRKLENLLESIDRGDPNIDWFAQLTGQMVDSFGDELCIENGRVYTETYDGFRLDRDFRSLDPSVAGFLLPPDYPPLQMVLQHGVYLFDESVEGQVAEVEQRLGGFNSAALLVDSEPRRILAFGLKPGWERVHLDFALNTIRNAIKHRLGLEHLRTDIAQAAEIQQSLLPTSMPVFRGYSIAARSIPAEQGVGGDFYDFNCRRNDLYLALGDVSGHGLPSALLARDVITGLRMATEDDLKITAILERLNRVVARSILSTRFVSLFFGSLEDNGNLFYVNAGHYPPWVFGERGVRRLRIGGTIIGPLKDARFKRGFEHVDRGDTLVVATDGILERLDDEGREFGPEALEALVAPVAGGPAAGILDAIFQAAGEHGGGRPWLDDVTAIVISRESARAS
ncbi:MAG: PP2C family protein-serine/threonine phosphatase [Acidobacteriota bacterium]|jgi:sigma-B regulation protein RsbU (phosphoserine phosphatase)